MVEPGAVVGSQHQVTGYGHDILGRVTLEEVELRRRGGDRGAQGLLVDDVGQQATEVGRDGTAQSFEYNADSQLTGRSRTATGRS